MMQPRSDSASRVRPSQKRKARPQTRAFGDKEEHVTELVESGLTKRYRLARRNPGLQSSRRLYATRDGDHPRLWRSRLGRNFMNSGLRVIAR
jgi:hypothetical protein